ncbi:MAG: hypothetical protein EBQ73_01535 [Gammaproteobacteria bacterium]|nr:hypothetical protein [Gammaproteobacteria bacterium]
MTHFALRKPYGVRCYKVEADLKKYSLFERSGSYGGLGGTQEWGLRCCGVLRSGIFWERFKDSSELIDPRLMPPTNERHKKTHRSEPVLFI